MTRLMLPILALVFTVSMPVLADDDEKKYQHFKPESAENLNQAISNLNQYNQELKKLVGGDLTAEEMSKVHELTYTLEVALQRLHEELEGAADSLEEVHLGSEEMNQQRVKSNGKKYLKTLSKVLGEK
ncbi:MAG: DUF6746 family protein [Pseudomonadota bacterium]